MTRDSRRGDGESPRVKTGEDERRREEDGERRMGNPGGAIRGVSGDDEDAARVRLGRYSYHICCMYVQVVYQVGEGRRVVNRESSGRGYVIRPPTRVARR